MVATKTQLDRQQAKTLSDNLLSLYGTIAYPDRQFDKAKFDKLFASDLKFITNDKIECNNLNQFHDRIKLLQKEFKSIHFSQLLEEPIISENRIILRYNIDAITKQGKQIRLNIITILTIEDGRVAKSCEVWHEQGVGQLEGLLKLGR